MTQPAAHLRRTPRLLFVVTLTMLIVGPSARRADTTVAATVGGIFGGATATEQADRIGVIVTSPRPVPLPASAQLVNTSNPDRVVGTGTPESCTSAAVVAAVASGGIITLDGSDRHRILYMNTCDPVQVWTTARCDNQNDPDLTVQNLTFTHGNSTAETLDGGGGGALFVRGGRVRIINSTFTNNRCDTTGPDIGGGALRVLSQYNGLPVIIATSTFTGNTCSNGGALSSIGQTWQVYNSTFVQNTAIGSGANPARPGTPGGGNGGAMYFDGNEFNVDIAGTVITDNTANEGGGALIFVSNNRTGRLTINQSKLERNTSSGFETAGYPGIFYLGQGPPQITDTTIK